ncbi:cation:proton antiporter regulatory subunit [Actinomadura sp. 21ATH]|uniref:cation:proton antiporter regulatory subunit n=1 Tax=Actinomadura sp. 21ATH TaxID=1735444 RepID=UPI0035BFF352
MLLDRTVLPKVGFLYAFTTTAGRRAGVVAHRDGRRDLVLYDPHDHDSVRCTVELTGTEPRTVAELLGPPAVADHVPDLARALDELRVTGLRAVRVPLGAASPYAGRTLGDLRTPAPIVAVQRAGRTITSPGAGLRLRPGDELVAVGDATATAALRALLAPAPHPANPPTGDTDDP